MSSERIPELMSERKALFVVISASLAGIFLSIVIHSRYSTPNIYSDIGSFYNSGGGRDWIKAGAFPYITPGSFFEYPPISGLVIYFARIVGGNSDGYYLVISALSAVAAVGLAWSTWRVAKRLGTRLWPIYFILPSMIFYGLYNFDLFDAFFLVFGLQMYLEGRKDLSAIALGLAISTRLIGIVLLPVYLLDLDGRKVRLRYIILLAATILVFYLPVILANSDYLACSASSGPLGSLSCITNTGYVAQFVDFFRNWGLEDAWYVWIFQSQATWGFAKIFGFSVTGLLLVWVYSRRMPLVPKVFFALTSYLLGTYIYAPQFNVDLIPFVALLGIQGGSLYVWDIFNVLIILTWFQSSNPTMAGSVPQAMSLIRTAGLALMGLMTYLRIRKEGFPPFEGFGELTGSQEKVGIGTAAPFERKRVRSYPAEN